MYFKTLILRNLHKESDNKNSYTNIQLLGARGKGGGGGGGVGEDPSTRNMLAGGLYYLPYVFCIQACTFP